jgi:hypothetical protein
VRHRRLLPTADPALVCHGGVAERSSAADLDAPGPPSGVKNRISTVGLRTWASARVPAASLVPAPWALRKAGHINTARYRSQQAEGTSPPRSWAGSRSGLQCEPRRAASRLLGGPWHQVLAGASSSAASSSAAAGSASRGWQTGCPAFGSAARPRMQRQTVLVFSLLTCSCSSAS